MLKDSCEQCSSIEPPLVIQHTWHPRPYKNVKRVTVAKYGEIINDAYSVDKARDLLFETYGKEIEKETLLIVIDESIRYQKLEDVVTFCKKCAFLYDVRKKNLCPKCKSNYKHIGATACYKCIFDSISEE